MKFTKATEQYEKWLGQKLTLLPEDVEAKHKAMANDAFSFLRATFYRWIQVWPTVCAEVADATEVLAVGDLHVENYGTWRDTEGRLIWGVNDFDEAWPLPYTNDLVRLATSAHMAIQQQNLQIMTEDACDAILGGYVEGLKIRGLPWVLAERHDWLRRLATNELRNPVSFWAKLTSFPVVRNVPKGVLRELLSLTPGRDEKYKIVHRVAGLGSLGRERYVIFTERKGGLVAREAKALTSSACYWAYAKGPSKVMYNEVLDGAIRCPDPHVRESRRWIYRRLAPDCSRVELASLGKVKEEARLLRAMGWELANIHLGTSGARAKIMRDLAKRKKRWLHRASALMAESVMNDWAAWKKNVG